MFVKRAFILVAAVMIPFILTAQQEKQLIAKGNDLYKDTKYAEAEISYRKSLEKKKESLQGAFNLGDALYKQGKFEEAASQFQQITASNHDEQTQAKAYHNLGNALLKSKKLEESIEAYKNALKKSPKDEESKYNLSYAKSLLNQQKKEEKNKDKKDDKKDKDKEKKEEDKKDKGDQKDEDKKDKGDKGKDANDDKDKGKEDKQEKGDKQEGKNQPKKPQQLSPEDAQRMLDALNQQEKNVQKKLTKKEAQRIEIEKNW